MPDPALSGPAADERQLILQAQEGSEAAFRILVEKHMKRAYNVAYGFLHDHDGAEDVAQEAFVRAHEHLPSFRGDAQFGTWLYRIVVNLSLNSIRHMRRRVQRETPLAETGSLEPVTAPDTWQIPELREQIERTLHRLPTLQRAVVILRHCEGLSTRQVAGILGCSEGTVKTHLFRGLEKMRKGLQPLVKDSLP